MTWVFFPNNGIYQAFIAQNRVAMWPPDETNRIKCDFRFSLLNGPPAPLAQRYLIRMLLVPPEPVSTRYALIDLDVSGNFELSGTTGPDFDGREVFLTVTEHIEPDFSPVFLPGIEYHFLFTMPGFDDFNYRFFVQNRNMAGAPKEIPYDWDPRKALNQFTIIIDDPLPQNIDWPPDDSG